MENDKSEENIKLIENIDIFNLNEEYNKEKNIFTNLQNKYQYLFEKEFEENATQYLELNKDLFDSFKFLYKYIKITVEEINKIKNNDILFFFGSTGSGKSLLINCLNNTKVKIEHVEQNSFIHDYLKPENNSNIIKKVGYDSCKSCDLIMSIDKFNNGTLEGKYFIEVSSLDSCQDNEFPNLIRYFANMFFISYALRVLHSVKCISIIEDSAFKATKGRLFSEFQKIIKSIESASNNQMIENEQIILDTIDIINKKSEEKLSDDEYKKYLLSNFFKITNADAARAKAENIFLLKDYSCHEYFEQNNKDILELLNKINNMQKVDVRIRYKKEKKTNTNQYLMFLKTLLNKLDIKKVKHDNYLTSFLIILNKIIKLIEKDSLILKSPFFSFFYNKILEYQTDIFKKKLIEFKNNNEITNTIFNELKQKIHDHNESIKKINEYFTDDNLTRKYLLAYFQEIKKNYESLKEKSKDYYLMTAFKNNSYQLDNLQIKNNKSLENVNVKYNEIVDQILNKYKEVKNTKSIIAHKIGELKKQMIIIKEKIDKKRLVEHIEELEEIQNKKLEEKNKNEELKEKIKKLEEKNKNEELKKQIKELEEKNELFNEKIKNKDIVLADIMSELKSEKDNNKSLHLKIRNKNTILSDTMSELKSEQTKNEELEKQLNNTDIQELKYKEISEKKDKTMEKIIEKYKQLVNNMEILSCNNSYIIIDPSKNNNDKIKKEIDDLVNKYFN